jgi:hypothetical protein
MEFIQPLISEEKKSNYWYYSNVRSIGTQTEEVVLNVEDYKKKLRSYCKKNVNIDK